MLWEDYNLYICDYYYYGYTCTNTLVFLLQQQVNNNKSPFGFEYQKYWEGAGQQRINKRKLKTAENLEDITGDLMETIAEDIGNCARKRHHAISSLLASTSASNVSSSSSSSLPSTSKSSTKHSTSSISLNLRSQVQTLMELVNKFDTR